VGVTNLEPVVYWWVGLGKEMDSGKKNVSFEYDAFGNRIAKHVFDDDWMLEKSTYYILDAQGNQLSMYEHVVDENEATVNYTLSERNIYGSSRLGKNNQRVDVFATHTENSSSTVLGETFYELSNHLGNVLTVINDIKIPLSDDNETVSGYDAGIVSISDYSPFGVQLDGRTLSADGYRYGFQGQEKDDEVKGAGNSVNYTFRMHDPRVGRFFAVDPLAPEYPHYSPYSFSGNRVIDAVELEGLEPSSIHLIMVDGEGNEVYNSYIEVPNGGHLGEYFLENSLSFLGLKSKDFALNSHVEIHFNIETWETQAASFPVFQLAEKAVLPKLTPDTWAKLRGTWLDPNFGFGHEYAPFEKVELKLALPSITVGGFKYEIGFTLKESGYSGGVDLWQYQKTSVTTDYSNSISVGKPSLVYDFVITKGTPDKLNSSVKVDGSNSYLKMGTSMNTNGEIKFSVGVSLPSKPNVKTSIEIEIHKTEKKITP
jgi:RHS repeat-associated protein